MPNELDMDAYHQEGIDPGEHKVFSISPVIHSFNDRFQGQPTEPTFETQFNSQIPNDVAQGARGPLGWWRTDTPRHDSVVLDAYADYQRNMQKYATSKSPTNPDVGLFQQKELDFDPKNQPGFDKQYDPEGSFAKDLMYRPIMGEGDTLGDQLKDLLIKVADKADRPPGKEKDIEHLSLGDEKNARGAFQLPPLLRSKVGAPFGNKNKLGKFNEEVTNRNSKILEGLDAGKSPKDIAKELGMGEYQIRDIMGHKGWSIKNADKAPDWFKEEMSHDNLNDVKAKDLSKSPVYGEYGMDKKTWDSMSQEAKDSYLNYIQRERPELLRGQKRGPKSQDDLSDWMKNQFEGGPIEPTYESLSHARNKPNEQQLLEQRQRQIQYDKKLSGTQDESSGERQAIKERLKELREFYKNQFEGGPVEPEHPGLMKPEDFNAASNVIRLPANQNIKGKQDSAGNITDSPHPLDFLLNWLEPKKNAYAKAVAKQKKTPADWAGADRNKYPITYKVKDEDVANQLAEHEATLKAWKDNWDMQGHSPEMFNLEFASTIKRRDELKARRDDIIKQNTAKMSPELQELLKGLPGWPKDEE